MGSPQACIYHKHSSSCHHVLIHAAHAASGHAALGVAGVLALVVNFFASVLGRARSGEDAREYGAIARDGALLPAPLQYLPPALRGSRGNATNLLGLAIPHWSPGVEWAVGGGCAVVKTLVNMEQSYVTAAFFRHRTAERYKAMMQAQQTARLLGEGGPPPAHLASAICAKVMLLERMQDCTGLGSSVCCRTLAQRAALLVTMMLTNPVAVGLNRQGGRRRLGLRG